jgi:hypothetical protein
MKNNTDKPKIGFRGAVLYIALLIAGFVILGLCQWNIANVTSRIVNGLFAVIIILMALGQIRTGEMQDIDGQAWMTRRQKPFVFWGMNLALIGLGALLFIQRVWK